MELCRINLPLRRRGVSAQAYAPEIAGALVVVILAQVDAVIVIDGHFMDARRALAGGGIAQIGVTIPGHGEAGSGGKPRGD